MRARTSDNRSGRRRDRNSTGFHSSADRTDAGRSSTGGGMGPNDASFRNVTVGSKAHRSLTAGQSAPHSGFAAGRGSWPTASGTAQLVQSFVRDPEVMGDLVDDRVTHHAP